MPSWSYIKSKLPLIIQPLISANKNNNKNNNNNHVPITTSILLTPFITQKLYSTLTATKNSLSLLSTNGNASSYVSQSSSLVKILRSRWTNYYMNNKSYFLFQCLLKSVKSHCKLSTLALAAAMWMVRIERVPFTGRYHVVLRGPKFTWIPSQLRDKLTDFWISAICKDRKYKTQASTNIKVIGVTSILAEIVKTMHSTFGLEKESTITTFQSPRNNSTLHRLQTRYTIGSPKNHPSTLLASTRKGKLSRWYATKHLEGKEWKVAVIESPEMKARLLPNSTIFITTALINNLSDIELATVMAHEIGHHIAQHRFDTLWWSAARLLVTLPMMIVLGKLAPSYYPTHGDFFGSLHGHRQEYEADFISLMLVASMGYDPRKAMKFYEKDYLENKAFVSTHPSLLKRTEALEKNEKMEKAMNAYMQAKVDNKDIKIKRNYIYN